MCSELITFVRVVDRHNLITVRRVWSSQCSHTVCLTSADRPHEASDLIGSSRMLVRCRTLLTADADRTPSILICWLFECSRSSIDVVERLIKFFLKFGGLTTLVAHFLTSRTPGRNPRVLTKNPASTFVSFLFFSLESSELPTHAQGFLTPTILSPKNSTHAPPSLLF